MGDLAFVIGREVRSSSSESSKAASKALTRLVGVSITGDCGVGLLLGEPAREGFEEDMLIKQSSRAVQSNEMSYTAIWVLLV